MNEEEPFFLKIHLTSGVDQSQEAYEVLHQDEYIARIPSFYHWFSDKLKLLHQGRFLDIACGSGEFLKLTKDNGLQACGVLKMARVLRPGGIPHILVPNTFSLLTNVWNAF